MTVISPEPYLRENRMYAGGGMKGGLKKLGWIMVSCLMTLSLVLASCGTRDEDKKETGAKTDSGSDKEPSFLLHRSRPASCQSSSSILQQSTWTLKFNNSNRVV